MGNRSLFHPEKSYAITTHSGSLHHSARRRTALKTLQVLRGIKDSFVYIPKNVDHGLKNTGEEDLEILWIFPTDCWEKVEYFQK